KDINECARCGRGGPPPLSPPRGRGGLGGGRSNPEPAPAYSFHDVKEPAELHSALTHSTFTRTHTRARTQTGAVGCSVSANASSLLVGINVIPRCLASLSVRSISSSCG